MIVQRKQPPDKNKWVDLIWYVHEHIQDESKRLDTITPSGHIHLVYNLEDPYEIVDEGQASTIPDIVLVGQLTKAYQIRYGAHVRQFGIAIKPAAFYRIFGEACSLYTDVMMDCSGMDKMRKFHRYILNILEDQAGNEEMMLVALEGFLSGIFFDDETLDDDEQMIHYIEERQGIIDVKEMAEDFHYSVSTLERHFKKKIGLTPKSYGDILRFRHAMMEEEPTVLYYDQSHFIRNCKKYTDKIPSDLMASDEITLTHILDLD